MRSILSQLREAIRRGQIEFEGDDFTAWLEEQRRESAKGADNLREVRHSILLDNGLDYDTLNKRLYGRYPKARRQAR